MFFIIGFLWRLFLASIPQYRVFWDMAAYNELAHAILRGEWAAHCCNHGAGYPLFLSLIYSIFGMDNFFAVRLIQVLLDLVSGLLIAACAKNLFGAKVSRIAFILYMLNPFTSAYTGLLLGETLLVFVVSLIAYLLVSRPAWWHWLLFGALFGYLIQIKIAYVFFIPIVALVTIGLRPKRLVLAFLGFFIVSLYALFANYAVFQKVSVIPPYRTAGGMLYASFSVGRYPELVSDFSTLSDEWRNATDEYYRYVDTKPELMHEYDQKYTEKFKERMKGEWPIFIQNTIQNIIYLWDKRFLLLFIDPFYPKDTQFLRIINISLIALFIIGIARFARKPIVVFSLIYFTALSLVFGLVISESRLTIPAYPIIILWAAYGL
ncbi:MAG: hypothetical protein ACD_36C00001G0001, partial [uncultured bacterium]